MLRPSILVLPTLVLAGAAVGRGEVVVSVHPTKDVGPAAPVEVTSDVAMTPGRVTLAGEALPEIPGCVLRDGDRTILVARLPRIGGTEPLELVIRPTKKTTAEGAPVFSAREIDGRLRVEYGGKLVTELIRGEFKPYFYPVMIADDVSVTRSYPMKPRAGEDEDHPHQRSMWFTHGNVNGFDFWASDPLNKPSAKFGTIRETACEVVADNPLLARIRTRNDWLGPDGRRVCRDERVVRFYGAVDGVRLVDFDVVVTASDGPVVFGETKEGSFGLRLASSLDVKRGQGGRILNAEGLTDGAAWGQASPWVDYSGPLGGKAFGVTILNHPSSFRFPTTWHVRDYGLFAANPFGGHDFGPGKRGAHTIPPDGTMTLRYRLVLHPGGAAESKPAEAFGAYADAPKVTFTER